MTPRGRAAGAYSSYVAPRTPSDVVFALAGGGAPESTFGLHAAGAGCSTQ